MTWLLIAAALIWCPTYIGLRLHASWAPPEPPTPLAASVRNLIEGGQRAVEASLKFGAALARVGMSAQAAAEAMRRAAPAFNAIRDDSPTDCRTPDLETP